MLKFFRSVADLLHGKHSDEICAVSTLSAIMEGVYQGTISGAELRKKGDFGLGTFDALDGEMMMLDNVIYRGTPDGKLTVMDAKVEIAYAVVKFFGADKTFEVNYVSSMSELNKRIDEAIALNNVMLGIKVTGEFESIRLRAVPKQVQPYPKFCDVAKNQTEFELKNVRGTLVGFRFPAYTGEVSVAGFHHHFVSEDRTTGGHVLGCVIKAARVQCDISRELHALLPDSKAFDGADLDHDHKDVIAAHE